MHRNVLKVIGKLTLASFALGSLAFVAMLAAFAVGAVQVALVALGCWIFLMVAPVGALARSHLRAGALEEPDAEDPA